MRATLSCHFVGALPAALFISNHSYSNRSHFFFFPSRSSTSAPLQETQADTKLDSLFDPSSDSESESESGAAEYSECSSVASFVSAPFCPTSPPRPVATDVTTPTLQQQLESASPAKLKLLCGKFAAESAAKAVLAEEYKAQLAKIDKLELKLTARLDRNERKLTRAITLLTEAHERIAHLCETVEVFEQDQETH